MTKDRRIGAERVLFAAPPPDNAQVTSLEQSPLPPDLEAAAYAASPASLAAAAAIAMVIGAVTPTLASSEVWSRLTVALHTHDWHAAKARMNRVNRKRARCARMQPLRGSLASLRRMPSARARGS